MQRNNYGGKFSKFDKRYKLRDQEAQQIPRSRSIKKPFQDT